MTGIRCTLSDAGSTYGTQVNGAPLKGETDLKAGDVFMLLRVATSGSRRGQRMLPRTA